MSLLTGHSVSVAKTSFFSRNLWKKPFPLPQDMKGQQLRGQSPEHPTKAFIPVGPNAASGSPPAGNDDPIPGTPGMQEGNNSKIRDPRPVCHCCSLTLAPTSNTKPSQCRATLVDRVPALHRGWKFPKIQVLLKPRLGRGREKVTLLQKNTPQTCCLFCWISGHTKY